MAVNDFIKLLKEGEITFNSVYDGKPIDPDELFKKK